MTLLAKIKNPKLSSHTPLYYQSATALVAQLHAGDLSCKEVLQAHLNQIKQVNVELNAIVTFCEDRAFAQAQALDALAPAAKAELPLFGLPIAHKDLGPTAGVRTTSGSPIFADYVPDTDSLQVTRLRNAGAIMLGKTNTPEFGAGSQTFNAVFGATRNPYDPTTTCGGSSGGAAVALAAGMLPIADGSDLGGSLRNPAAFCNVVGLRPSLGRVPTWPSADAWNPLGTEGPMARSVTDTALLLSVMAGPDDAAPTSLDTPGSVFRGMALRSDLKGLRLAFSPDFGGQLPVAPEITNCLNALRPTLVGLGAEVVDACCDFSDARDAFSITRAWMFATKLGPLVDAHPDKVKDTIHWNVKLGRAITWEQLSRAQDKRNDMYHRLREFMSNFDALLLPTTQVLPFSLDQEYPTSINGQPMHDYLEWMQSCSHITITGHPALSLPAGFAPRTRGSNLPVGLQIVGPHRGDAQVLQIAHAIEQATGCAQQRPPE